MAAVWEHDGFHSPIGKSNTILLPPVDGAVAPAPLANADTVWNGAKGGSTLPLKFNVKVGGEERTSTGGDTIKSFNATKITCPKSTPITDAVEELAASGTSTGLRYADGQYIQNWKTPSVSGDTCYRVALVTADSSAMYTFVRLRK